MKCKYVAADGSIKSTTVDMKQFAPQCTKSQIASGNCTSANMAYLPAITVCQLKLF